MTAETSNARWEVVAERQAWYEQQIALAEGQWAEAFLDRWECGDDVPSKEHYVALWLAERAAPPPADAEVRARELLAACAGSAHVAEIIRSNPFAGGLIHIEHALRAIVAALSQQPDPKPEARGVVDDGSRSVTRQLLHWRGIPVCVTGTVTTSPSNWPLIDAALTEARDVP